MTRRERLLGMLYTTPRNPEIDERKRRFDDINAYIAARGGWLTSVSGAREVTVECLPGSSLPDDLRTLGYDVTTAGDGERVLSHQIVERFVRRADGELEPLTAEIAEPRTHAGIVKVKRYSFDMP